MNQTLRVASLVFNQPLLVEPNAAITLVSGLADRFGIEPLADVDLSRFVGRPDGPRGDDGRTIAMYREQDGVALISVLGELVNRGAWIGASSGLTSYEGLDAQLAAAEAPNVRAVILDMNTPGGEASGAMETAAKVRALAAKKPVYAFVNGQAASAGYAIASGASKIVTTPSGVLGSIGVVWMHLDRSAQVEKSGVRPTLLTAGAYKADGHPFAALPDAARSRIQSRIDDVYDLFVRTVAAHRGMSLKAVRGTEAGVFMGQGAVDAGLADAVGGLDDVFAMVAADLNQQNERNLLGAVGRAMETSLMTEYTAEQISALESTARTAGETDGRSAAITEISAALAQLFPDDARASTFVEALADGVAVSTAAKFAGKIAAPAPAAAPERTHRLDSIVPNPVVDAGPTQIAEQDRVGAGLNAAMDALVGAKR